jgi:hypothetical protein
MEDYSMGDSGVFICSGGLFLRFFVCARWARDDVPTLLMFCRKLAWELINNNWIGRQERNINIAIDDVHTLTMAPKHA